ncbi:MAG: PAS domain-containing protein [Actinomycetota bacterium]
MAQHPVEIILLQQWASLMAVPIWITDEAGGLIYYNEPAEPIIGLRFDEAGELPAEVLGERLQMCDLDGSPLPEHERPLMIALTKQLPAHRRMRICGMDGQWRQIAGTALPLIGEGQRHLGAVAMFWEDHD